MYNIAKSSRTLFVFTDIVDSEKKQKVILRQNQVCASGPLWNCIEALKVDAIRQISMREQPNTALLRARSAIHWLGATTVMLSLAKAVIDRQRWPR